MKKYITLSILSILLFILLVIVFILLWQFKVNADFTPQFVKEMNTQQNTPIKNQIQEPSWQEELAQWPKKDFTPAAEKFTLYFDADISELKEKNKYYQLIIGKYDIYSMFCLRQTLNSFNVKYFLLQSGNSPEIFLDTSNEKLIQDIMKELKKYKINTEIKEIWL